ncbi:PREDICTED: zinc-finger homeodomain protein 2 [Brassica oleracea var. oleracea]|uniref:ZF-HD dimerization-type domain-containing protein n=1 Tax=Brassica oleracea var. oleracea TaxID=109376 RepID=A0A0D3A613_BRAOL|nr:PREDICTED: zinc-finger homeodomain protein 2 [Brassica oleracea var. oleracea]
MNFEEQEEEMEMSGVNPAGGYDSLSGEGATSSGGGGGGSRKSVGGSKIRYRECLKNHAVNIGGHAVDGCCEFMPSGEDGSLDALKCAACGCHRNFHRKETEIMSGRAYRAPTYYNRPPQLPPPGYLHLTSPAAAGQPYRPTAASGDEEDTSNPSSSGGTRAKRFRTKFTAEQKEKMLAFAERLGWRIQKHDDAAVEQFCAETGVRRQVLKIWMHNNKNSLGKKP